MSRVGRPVYIIPANRPSAGARHSTTRPVFVCGQQQNPSGADGRFAATQLPLRRFVPTQMLAKRRHVPMNLPHATGRADDVSHTILPPEHRYRQMLGSRDIKPAIISRAPTAEVGAAGEGRKRKLQPSACNELLVDGRLDISGIYELLGDAADSGQLNAIPRKRERLTNLSAEEKLNRRKMKNRVAAQSARDRKKERTHKLEGVVRHLLMEAKQLRAENRALRLENERILRGQFKAVAAPKRQGLQQPMLSSAEVSSSDIELEKGGLSLPASKQHQHHLPAAFARSGAEEHPRQAAAAQTDACPASHPESEIGVEGGKESADGDDLQAIFDDLFEGTNPSMADINKFCNEIIEEEIASSTLLGATQPFDQQEPGPHEPTGCGWSRDQSIGGGGTVAEAGLAFDDPTEAHQAYQISTHSPPSEEIGEQTLGGYPQYYSPTDLQTGLPINEFEVFDHHPEGADEVLYNFSSPITPSSYYDVNVDDTSLVSEDNSFYCLAPSFDFEN